MYMTVGVTMGDGDLLSLDRWWSVIRLSGLELSIRSGDTHLMTGLRFWGTTRHANMM